VLGKPGEGFETGETTETALEFELLRVLDGICDMADTCGEIGCICGSEYCRPYCAGEGRTPFMFGSGSSVPGDTYAPETCAYAAGICGVSY
jgi:hypothetical protein